MVMGGKSTAHRDLNCIIIVLCAVTVGDEETEEEMEECEMDTEPYPDNDNSRDTKDAPESAKHMSSGEKRKRDNLPKDSIDVLKA